METKWKLHEFRATRKSDTILLSENGVIESMEKNLDEILEQITDENRHGEISTGEPVGNEII